MDSFEDLKSDPPLYKEIDGIKIYTGTTQCIKTSLNRSIDSYKNVIMNSGKEMLLSPLKPSTLTAKGKFSNISFSQKWTVKNHRLLNNNNSKPSIFNQNLA